MAWAMVVVEVEVGAMALVGPVVALAGTVAADSAVARGEAKVEDGRAAGWAVGKPAVRSVGAVGSESSTPDSLRLD